MLKHGHAKRTGRSEKENKIYNSWSALRQRCNYVKSRSYPRYGGRGIRVCTRWDLFSNFWDDMQSSWFKGATIERINLNGDYEPGNCKWITGLEQIRNRSVTRWVTYKDKKVTVSELGRILGIQKRTFFDWVDKYSIEEIELRAKLYKLQKRRS